jgi:hypothetical protein
MPLAPRLNMAAYVVTRSVPGAPVNGRPAAPTTSTINITANVQPMNGETLKTLPEARHTEDMRILFTATLLHASRAGYLPDKIAIGSNTFEVIQVGGWPGHYEVIATKVNIP